MSRKKINVGCCEYCGDPAKTAGLCHKHYQYAYHWGRKGVAAARQHRKKLEVRKAILDGMTPKPVAKSNGRYRETRAALN